MDIVLTPSLPERKRILNIICREHPQWKLRFTIAVALFVLAAGVLVYFAAMFIRHKVFGTTFLVFMTAVLIFACVPYAFGLWAKNSARYTCALPYSSYANGTLLLSEEKLDYVFWKVEKRDPAAFSRKGVFSEQDRFVFSIPRSEICSMTISNDICTIVGTGQLRVPNWEDGSASRQCTEFSFILAFDQENAATTIEEWRN